MNKCETWRQGKFLDAKAYRNWSQEQKEQVRKDESHLVRPGGLLNAICRCDDPRDAEWIASRLNLAAKLEKQLKLNSESGYRK